MWSLRVLLLAAGASCVSTRSLRAASVPIYEDTPAPGDSSSVYPICTEYNTLAFSQAILKESNECAIKTSYNWQSTLLPTASERRELCVCKSLMDKLQTVKVPRCSLYRSGSLVSYAQVAEYAFGLCPYGSSSGSKTSTTPTSAPVRSDTDASETGSGEGDEKKEKSKVAMIAGIAGGVVAVIIIAVIAFRCGKSRKTEKAEDVATTSTPTPPVRKRVETRRDVVDAMPLSPLEIETATHYTGVVASPAVRETKSNNRKSTTGTNSTKRTTISTGSGATTGSGNGSRGARHMRPSEHGLWEDTAILAVRIPHDAIFFGPLLSRGGYGEVYRGTYKGETVAIKQLLPGRRKDMNQIDLFMAEVKLMSSLEHERIVRFIGVAWNSLSDVCVVVEYMENGDLRSVLARWDGDEERRPNGFDADKTKIALHIAHALTYLHSLQPVVVHRDLKSKNILLDNNLDAKLTDFGVSRERADSTMTAGVGSSLWMAPEVMLGERYDEKADVFSFGVVLSELDTHKLPYSHAKESGTNQKVPDAAILQMVSLGRLSIEFTECADEAFVQLGRECVALDPKQRPTSAQVLHRVHQLYRQYS